MTTIYTACYGGYDNVQPQRAQDMDVRWVLFTDDAELVAPPPWERRVVAAPYPSPRLSSKWFKFLPHECIPDPDAIWIDANMTVTSAQFARGALATRRQGFAVWAHPQRHCIYDEAEATLRLCPEKYLGQPIMEQVAHYRELGHPANAGLYATGTLAWDTRQAATETLGRVWLAECEQWSYQDQLSLPVVVAALGLEPGIFPYRQIGARRLANKWLTINPHNRSD